MGLIVPSAITNATVGQFFNPSVNAIRNQATTPPTANPGLESTIASAAATIANNVGSVLTEATTAVANAIDSTITGATSLLGETSAGLANAITGVFGNTLAGIGVNVNIPIPDPVASSFNNGTPQGSLFATNSLWSQVQPITFGAMRSNQISAALSLNLSSLLSRFGITSSADLSPTAGTDLQQLAMVGNYGNMPSLIPTNTSTSVRISALIANDIPGYSSGNSSVSGPYNPYTDYTGLSSPLAQTLTGSSAGLSGFYNPALPNATNAGGSLISGMPPTIPSSLVNQLSNTLSGSLGISSINLQTTPYGAQQSLFDGIYTLSARLGITPLITQMNSATPYFGPTTQAQARAVLPEMATNPAMASALITGAGPTTLALPESFLTELLTNPTLTASDVPTVSGILTTLNQTPETLYTAPTSGNGITIWNSGLMGQTPQPIVDGLLNQPDTSLLTRGSVLPFSANQDFTAPVTTAPSVLYGHFSGS